MKTLLLTSFITVFAYVAMAQTNDKIYKHSGETLEAKVLKVSEYTVTFTYPGEQAEQVLGRYAVGKIVYGASNRTEKITDKIDVSGKDGWENVVIVEDKTAVSGLKSLGEVRGKTAGMLAIHTAGSADKKSTKKLKMAAAEQGAQFVLITSNKDNNFTLQSIKGGIAYGYK